MLNFGDSAAIRKWRYEKKNLSYALVRKAGGGPRERQRMMRKIENGLVRPGYQGKLREKFGE